MKAKNHCKRSERIIGDYYDGKRPMPTKAKCIESTVIRDYDSDREEIRKGKVYDVYNCNYDGELVVKSESGSVFCTLWEAVRCGYVELID